jgi:putative chitinase
MIRALAVVRRLCPRAHPNYLAAFDAGDDDLVAAGVTTPLRLAHFLAQAFHETDGLTILVESMNYSAKRMTEVWPKRFPSVAVAAPYAHNPRALAEHTYGGRMGNGPEGSGDGFAFIGRGTIQCTGRESYAKFGSLLGIDLAGNPDLAIDPRYVLKIALAEWTEKGCNALADRNAIKDITEKINGGRIGLDDRVKWFDRVWPVVQEMHGSNPAPSWQAAEPDPDVEGLQKLLVAAGYTVDVDGRKGPQTVKAIKAFQRDHRLEVDGVAGPRTRAGLADAVAPADAKAPRVAPPAPAADTTAPGVGLAALGQGGQTILDKVSSLQSFVDVPGVKTILAVLTVVGVGLVVWGIVGPSVRATLRPGAPA